MVNTTAIDIIEQLLHTAKARGQVVVITTLPHDANHGTRIVCMACGTVLARNIRTAGAPVEVTHRCTNRQCVAHDVETPARHVVVTP